MIESNDDSCAFSWDQKSDSFGLGKPVKSIKPIKVRLGEPIPSNPKFIDYHEMPDPIFSQRVIDILAPMNIYGVQLVPAKVSNPNDPFDNQYNYWFMHVWNHIECLDTKKSELEYSRSGNTIFGIERLVLNEKILETFELSKRLIFELAEDTSVLLVHQTIKDVIMSVDPKGCRFFKATEWDSDITFT